MRAALWDDKIISRSDVYDNNNTIMSITKTLRIIKCIKYEISMSWSNVVYFTSCRIRSKFNFNKIFIFFVRHFVYIIPKIHKSRGIQSM